MSNNKFANALKPDRRSSSGGGESSPRTERSTRAQSERAATRRNAKHIGGYFDPTVSKQLRQIALEEDSSVQLLLGEALDMLFQARRKPTIAQRPVHS
ncbi:MAG: hypothetical protein HOO98_16235 [Nitrospira sp.]|nr:hypothetical protein [Nitrospira sp.]